VSRRRLLVYSSVPLFGAALLLLLLGREEPASHAAPHAAAPAVSRPKVGAPSLRSATPPASAAVPSAPRPLVIVAGGDVNLGRECGQSILADPKYDPFRQVAPLLRDADLAFVNLESQLSEQKGETQSPYNRLIFTGPPGGGATLAQAGIDVASTANNHAWDYRRRALLETLDNLAGAGVKSVGTGRTLEQAYAPAILEVRGKRIAVFAVTQVWNDPPFEQHEGRNHVAWARPKRLLPALERARREADVVLVSYHGGAEYQDAPAPPARNFFKAIMKGGLVDAVLGHHPHVPQGVGWSDGKPIFYSLGNFVFAGHDWAPRTKLGFLARLEIDAGGTLSAWACPVAIDGHVPAPIAPNDPKSKDARAHLIGISTATGGSEVGEPDASGCFPLRPPAR